MPHHILIPTDGSDLSATAVERALSLAQALSARVTILTVVEPFRIVTTEVEQLERTRAEYERFASEQASRLLSEVESKAKALGVPCEAVQLKGDHPYKAIIDTAKAKGCDLIAMASHGRGGVSAVLLGSETLKVLTHSKIPVLVYR